MFSPLDQSKAVARAGDLLVINAPGSYIQQQITKKFAVRLPQNVILKRRAHLTSLASCCHDVELPYET
jgi:hypothetical protein